jgi:uncharacterized protein (TIGR03437 family)
MRISSNQPLNGRPGTPITESNQYAGAPKRRRSAGFRSSRKSYLWRRGALAIGRREKGKLQERVHLDDDVINSENYAMNRRRFLESGAAALPIFWRYAAAQQQAHSVVNRDLIRAPKLVKRALTTPNMGFPAVKPLFSGVFVPSSAPAQLLRTESWNDFVETAQQMAASYRLSCFTAIQNLNRSWYYCAFQPGSADYLTLQTADPAAFMAAFNNRQTSYTLVDFNVSWQGGQLLYSGFWTANVRTPQLLVLDLPSFADLSAQAMQYSSAQAPMEMTRVQAYPLAANVGFAALYQAGKGTGIVHDMDFPDFLSEVGSLPGNTLVGLAYNPVEGHLAGTWQAQIIGAEFFVDQTWDTVAVMAQSGSNKLAALAVYPDAPSFDDYFEANLAPYVMGYGYAVGRNGQIIASGGGYARSPHEADNPALAYSADSRMTLASVSKAITGVAIEKLALQKGISLDDPFLPLLNGKATSPYPSVGTITLRNLATMQSGLFQETNEGPADVPQGEDIWTEINNYLMLAPAGPPGMAYYYDNTNYSILQAVIEEQSGTDYVTYVNENLLLLAGMDPAIINPDPVLPGVPATLIYASPTDSNPGYQYGPFTLVGVSGWVSSARELVKLLGALQGGCILPQSVVSEMFSDSIGWNLPGNPASGPAPYYGNFGVYYWKEGGLTSPTKQSLQTFLVRLGEGYDLALLINSPTPASRSIDSICYGAFEARGLSAANLPQGGPMIQTAVNGASYLPMAAPGSYVAIIGSGFTSQTATDWSDAIGADGTLPIKLAGVQVRVGSLNAYVEYVSAGQVNILLPASLSETIANIELTTPDGGYSSSLQIGSVAPGLFTYSLHGKNYAAAVFGGTTGAIYVAAPGAISGESSRPAQAGDAIALYGTGMGPTNPQWPDGKVLDQAYSAADLSAFRMDIGGIQSTVTYAGMIEAGLFQVNIVLPGGLKPGDQTVVLSVHGFASQPNVFLTVG